MRPSRSSSTRSPADRSCAAGRSIARRRRCCAAPVTATTSCIAPATASAKTVHGNGVNMDDYETHDDRRLLVGTGFTIEPGVYFDDFGVRSEINMIVGAARRARHRAGADSNRCTRVGDRSMSTRKTTLIYSLPIAVASLAVGMVLASRLELTPTSSAQIVAAPPMNSAPITRRDRRPDLPQHRQGRESGGRLHQDRDEGPAGTGRTWRWRRRRRSLPSLLRRAAWTGPGGDGQDDADPNGGGPQPRRRTLEARGHRLHHQQGRLHPHQQPRRRGRDQDSGVALR